MAVISFGLLGLFWQLSAGTIFNTILVPSPGETFRTAWQMLQTGELGRHVGVSLMRVLIGYVCGCLLGVGLGAAIGRFRVFRELVEPLIDLIRPISPVAVVPLAMMWFGIEIVRPSCRERVCMYV